MQTPWIDIHEYVFGNNMKKEFINRANIKKAKDTIEDGIEHVVGEEELKQWKKFAFKGRMIEMAIAFILGAAFQKVVSSISQNLIMPMVNYVVGKTGEDWRDCSLSPLEGMTFELGQFAGSFLDFVLISIILYVVYRKVMFPLLKEDVKIRCIQTISCPECQEEIHYKASKCPFCTSTLKE